MLYTSSPELKDENREYMNHKDFSETLAGANRENSTEYRSAWCSIVSFSFSFYSEGKHRHMKKKKKLLQQQLKYTLLFASPFSYAVSSSRYPDPFFLQCSPVSISKDNTKRLLYQNRTQYQTPTESNLHISDSEFEKKD